MGLSDIFSWLEVNAFLANTEQKWGDAISICFLPGDVHFDYVGKVVSARFLHCEVTYFPLHLISEWYPDTMQIVSP